MKRSHRYARLLLAISIVLLTVLFVAAPLVSQATPTPSAEQTVQRAWQRAQEIGVYHFGTEIAQTVYPAPALVNVGRSSRQSTLHLEGQTNLPERQLDMTLWNGGGNALNAQDAVEIHIQGDSAQGRVSGGDWVKIDDFSDAFAPGKDLMAYLAGARNVREIGRTEDGRGGGVAPYASS